MSTTSLPHSPSSREMRPTASIVMPCYNVADTIEAQLDRILPQIDLTGAELVLVDNNSTDETSRILDELADRPNVVVGSATAGQSVAYARNAGVMLANSDRFLFCDADDLIGANWVDIMTTGLYTHHIVTGRLDAAELNTERQQAGRGDVSQPATFHGLFPLVHGGNMGVTREAWELVGPLDETLGSVEDIEWSLRAKAVGHPIVRLSDAVIHYRYRNRAIDLWHQGLLYGKYRPEIARRAHERLGVRVRRFAGMKSWAWLAINAVRVGQAEMRPQLAWVAGNRVGQVIGSIKSRFCFI